MLCIEGLVKALRVYLGKESGPLYCIASPKQKERMKVVVKSETSQIRPFVVAAILRDVNITQEAYDSFIEFQDKLHGSIGRKRSLVSMGTHDMDKIEWPVSYEALAPESIEFVPLNQSEKMNGAQLMKFYESDLKIKKFLHLIKDSPVFPVFFDNQRRVLSLPPLINSNHSKISLETKNIFIEITGTDYTKCCLTLNILITAFSQYCSIPYSVEQVDIHYSNGNIETMPDMSERIEVVSVDYINRAIGVDLKPEEMVTNLSRMMLKAKVSEDRNNLLVQVPPSRTDILHACDIMEDVAIAFGFNNIQKTHPRTPCVGSENPLNKLTDQLRREVAFCGFTEVLTLTLCSTEENYKFLRRANPGNEAVVLSNPKTLEYEVVRTTLLPGLLKTVSCSRSVPLPIKVFEFGDVVLLDSSADVLARNERRMAALYSGTVSGLEVMQGILDRLMNMLEASHGPTGYQVLSSENPTYLPGRAADIFYKGKLIGSYGILHPEVLENYSVDFVTSVLEINIEPFL